MRLEEFLAKTAQVKTFDEGQIIFKEDARADAAYYLIEGQVEIFKEDGGRPSVIAKLEPGEIFGEMALLRFDKYTLSARAGAPVKLYAIAPEALQDQLRQTPPLVKAILDMLVVRMQGANEVLIDLDRANRA